MDIAQLFKRDLIVHLIDDEVPPTVVRLHAHEVSAAASHRKRHHISRHGIFSDSNTQEERLLSPPADTDNE